MRTMFWLPQESREAVLNTLTHLATEYGLIDPKKKNPSMSQALVALTGQHPDVKFLPLPDSLAGVCARSVEGDVLFYLPRTPANETALAVMVDRHGGQVTEHNGWLAYASKGMDEAGYWQAYGVACSQ
jgi:hypothetical protein